MRKIKIGLFGWYHQGALADDLIGECIKTFLEDNINCTVDYHLEYFRGLKNKNEIAKRLNSYDLLIFGGGSLIMPLKLPPFNTIESWHSLVKTPLIIFGPGVRKESNLLRASEANKNRIFFKLAYKKMVRGYITQQEMLRNNINVPINCFGDPGILYKNTKSRIEIENYLRPYFGVVVRNIPDREKKDVTNQQVQALFQESLEEMLRDVGGTVVYIPYRYNIANYDNDYEASCLLKEKINYKNQIVVKEDLMKTLHYTTSMDFLVSQRLHPAIVGISNGVPTIAINYQFRKFEDFTSVIDYPFYLDPSDLNKSKLLSIYDDLRRVNMTLYAKRAESIRNSMKSFLLNSINDILRRRR